jgi:hypothetical protein
MIFTQDSLQSQLDLEYQNKPTFVLNEVLYNVSAVSTLTLTQGQKKLIAADELP